MKKKVSLLSNCCNTETIIDMSPDFYGDNSKTQIIGTCYYICTKCHQACDVHANVRKTWTRNPKIQIQSDKREKIKNKETEKEIQKYGNA